MGSRGWADAGHCSLSPQTCQQKVGMAKFGSITYMRKHTYRWSRGAIGRYQAAPGATLAAARVPRRPWTAPTTIPGEGRGLTPGSNVHVHVHCMTT